MPKVAELIALGRTDLAVAIKRRGGFTAWAQRIGAHVEDRVNRRVTLHGRERRLLREVHRRMIERCTNPSDPSWQRYGGRGIKVCDRWRHDFATFLADMGPRPSATSLDRIDNDGNYEPGNVRWATVEQQANNMRTNNTLTFRGRTQTIAQWARERGFVPDTIRSRIFDRGWSVERALTEPPRATGARTHRKNAVEIVEEPSHA